MSRMAKHAFYGMALCGALAAPAAQAATAAQPTVVELFTSQGCSSCPPANDNLRALADRPDVLALSFGVTYWDYLGWKDTFAQPAFTARQRDYEGPLGHAASFTPQVVVDGHLDTVGNVRGDIERLIAQSHRAPGPAITFGNGKIAVGASAPQETAQVWLVRYDPRIIQVPVARGENSGVTLPHKNVVRSLSLLGEWKGQAASFALPPAPAGLKTAVLVQDGRGGAIIAAARD
ncbi:MAG TPA: DUF1223 domain-containing protein [Rhizomicrobium sp.]|nr:DUF1223 domain-containing protein [Rhizomicrobium sp.]